MPGLQTLSAQSHKSSFATGSRLLLVGCLFFAIACQASLAEDANPQLRPSLTSDSKSKSIRPNRIRKDRRSANAIARNHWLDKAAQGNPQLIESITDFHSAAMIIAKHPRVGDIAEADHYLCRRLTRWKNVARALALNPQADRVIALDPQGIYTAVKKDRQLARLLARNPMFHHMISENPDLGQLLSTYM